MLTKPVRAVRKSEPDSLHWSKSFICGGRKPSGPPDEPAGSNRIAFLTSFWSTRRGVHCTTSKLGSIWEGSERLDLRLATVSSNGMAGASSKHTSHSGSCPQVAIFKLGADYLGQGGFRIRVLAVWPLTSPTVGCEVGLDSVIRFRMMLTLCRLQPRAGGRCIESDQLKIATQLHSCSGCSVAAQSSLAGCAA